VYLHGQGRKLRQIAREIGVHHTTISNWLRADDDASVEPTVEKGVGEVSGVRRRPTISDVAASAHVAVSTVSNFINGKGRMAAATRTRIQEAIDQLHYTPSALARAIRERRTDVIGLLAYTMGTVDAEKSIMPPLFAGISEAADLAGKDLHVYTGWPNRVLDVNGADLLSGRIDGLILVVEHEAMMERVAAAGLPVVAIFNRHVPQGVGYVNCDNIGAMGLVVDHLMHLGHKNIAFLCPRHGSNFADRHSGFIRSMKAHGMKTDTVLQHLLPGDGITSDAAFIVLKKWLSLTDRPTAVVCGTDGIATSVADAAVSMGLRIPEDLAVTGFDDVPLAQRVHGGLTTIRQPFREMGRIACERIGALIDGASVDECRVTLPAELVVRVSTLKPSLAARSN